MLGKINESMSPNITYEDEKGLVSLITGDYDVILEKNTIFNIKINCVAEECSKKINIKIDENINI